MDEVLTSLTICKGTESGELFSGHLMFQLWRDESPFPGNFLSQEYLEKKTQFISPFFEFGFLGNCFSHLLQAAADILLTAAERECFH